MVSIYLLDNNKWLESIKIIPRTITTLLRGEEIEIDNTKCYTQNNNRWGAYLIPNI